MRLYSVFPILLALGLTLAVPSPTTPHSIAEENENVFTERGCMKGISPATRAKTQQAFTKSGIIPAVIPALPQRLELRASYGGKAVNLGNHFNLPETLLEPNIYLTAQDRFDPRKTRYSVFILDPDAATTFLHFYKAHVSPAHCGAKDESTTVVAYIPFTPPSSAPHRYTFLAYREPPGYEPEIVTPQSRVGFAVGKYTAAAGLKLVGGNFLLEAAPGILRIL